jgi:hypothetical protein
MAKPIIDRLSTNYGLTNIVPHLNLGGNTITFCWQKNPCNGVWFRQKKTLTLHANFALSKFGEAALRDKQTLFIYQHKSSIILEPTRLNAAFL